jgi:hypothetical protein
MKKGNNGEHTSKRGMHGSKGQGGNEFDREKGEDKFTKSDKQQERDEVTWPGRGRGTGESSKNLNPGKSDTYYNGSTQHKGEEGNRRKK